MGGLFLNTQEGVPMRNTLIKLDHNQPPTPTRTDNTTAHGIIHGSCKPQKTKSMDMRYHWLKDRAAQQQFDFYWEPGKMNMGDFYTKHHPPKYHRALRPFILKSAQTILTDRHLQECVETLTSKPRGTDVTRDSSNDRKHPPSASSKVKCSSPHKLAMT